ncbi:Holliday junction DNA helicase subunit RuvA [Chthonomonas calidirosea]|uniref:Holliday junction branch migration complex subunit RuvA n=1 Tax=Chthonomonas calidirosea (strain DSM 23976 / ICMP 18418 / T49) TaxID=1303518 RepID=S0EZA2_CHTCT|nr:Holliday junction branch migration protein RuvA [Chthonomonas calidirosea]CCW36099.1 Holliday junction DNA helicase subunit RuvA [Chthonomonas calidirosea T49]CEK17292.1 Holliday junction DNA helicase subunit RuvA [Chthonomonas calidirosea]CEK18341.1 Holliday junction DNA helicase subunit RuvA [Chthonomonas calidirosea]
MIAQLRGRVVRADAGAVVLDVAGVGYLVHVPTPLLASLSACEGDVTLLTHLVVREDELSLYGFSRITELQIFRLLLGVSGVGPKAALALLSALDEGELARALATGDIKRLTQVPGVGPKLAQRLSLELGDKVSVLAFEQRIEQATGTAQRTALENAAWEDAIEGLVALGYSRADARRAIERVFPDLPDRTDAAALLQAGLKLLTSRRQ